MRIRVEKGEYFNRIDAEDMGVILKNIREKQQGDTITTGRDSWAKEI